MLIGNLERLLIKVCWCSAAVDSHHLLAAMRRDEGACGRMHPQKPVKIREGVVFLLIHSELILLQSFYGLALLLPPSQLDLKNSTPKFTAHGMQDEIGMALSS